MPQTFRKTCGQCHQGVVDAKFSIGPIHVQTDAGPNHPVVKWIRWTYWVLIPATLGFMLLHNLLDFLSKLIRRRPRRESGEVVLRMNLWFRIAHWGIMASFPTLVFTGFALKYPDSWWAKPLLLWESGVGVRGGLHRTAAIVMIAATVFHVDPSGLKKRDRSLPLGHDPGRSRMPPTCCTSSATISASRRRTAVRKIQLRGEDGILGLYVGHVRHGRLRVPALVQQFHPAPFPQMGDRRGHGCALV